MYIPPRQISISVTHCPKEAVTAVGGVLTACGRAEIGDARLRAILLSAKGVSPGVSCSSKANCLIESVQIPAVLELVSCLQDGLPWYVRKAEAREAAARSLGCGGLCSAELKCTWLALGRGGLRPT